MKYSEFYQTVKDMGFKMTEGMSDIYVENSYGDTVFLVSKDHMYNLDSDFEPFVTMKDEDKEFVFELVYRLTKTPLAEREEEKLYRVKFPNIKRSGLPIILTKVNWDGSGYTTMDWPCESYVEKHPEQFTFTEQEIKDIDERYLAFKVDVTPD